MVGVRYKYAAAADFLNFFIQKMALLSNYNFY